MKKETKIFLILLTVLFLILISLQELPEPQDFVKERTFTNYSNLFFYYEITRYPSGVEVVSSTPIDENVTLGFVVDPWNLNFGIVPTNGSYVKRHIELTNLREIPTRINLKVYGNITPLVSFSENNFVLHENEKVTIDVYLFTNNTEIGNYLGEVDVIAKKPRYDFIPV